MVDLKEVIAKAQAGDERAQNTLIKTLKDNGAMQQLARYLYRNRLLEPSDVRGEFWLGIAKGILNVKHNVGNPLQYLIQCGLWQVKSALRRAIRKGVIYKCKTCKATGQFRRITDRAYMEMACCPKCGGELETEELHIPLKDEHTSHLKSESRIERWDIDEFKMTLTIYEKRVFEFIETGYDRDNSKNYLRDIATEMRVTPQAINHHLRNIRTKLTSHLEKVTVKDE